MDLRDIVATRGFATYSLRHPLEALSSFGPTLNEATFGYLGESFQPERDIRSLDGKVVLVTGGTYTISIYLQFPLSRTLTSRLIDQEIPA